jgi:hypothetical protein
MDDIIEISELDWNTPTQKSSNFGSGIELLMNDKAKEGSKKMSSDINLDDLNNLENELNNLSEDTTYTSTKSNFFSGISSSDENTNDKSQSPGPGSGSGSVRFGGLDENSQTWDGYGKFNNIPLNPDTPAAPTQPQISKEEMLREKFKILRKLEALEKKGVEFSRKYTMESSLAEMQGEYETIVDEKNKKNSMKFQGNMLMAIINGIEFLNNRFDPFDIKLDGWSEQVNENIQDYDDIFGELFEKYKSRATMAPELKLLFQLGGSGMMIHMTNTMFKSAMPGMDDILRQNPDLMRQFQTAAVNSMGQSSPGLSGFMGGMMNGNDAPPPPPMATQGPRAVPPPTGRPGNNNYMNGGGGGGGGGNDGIHFRETPRPINTSLEQDRRYTPSVRPEMKGPSDISEILSGLKTKTISIPVEQDNNNNNNNSTISINDLKDLQGDGNVPKRSKRRPKSDKNTVSLDI